MKKKPLVQKRSVDEDPSSLGEQAYQAIRKAMRQRRFKCGDRLREAELAEMFGFSRTPIREALARLQVEGLAAENGQRGFSIIELDHALVTELYVIREVLEAAAAKLAARNAQDAEIAWLRSLHEEYAELVNTGKSLEMSEKNRQFHEALALCAHNRFLLRMLDPIRDTLGLLGESSFVDKKRAQENLTDHEEIVTALEARDPEKADQATKKHIQAAYASRIKRMFSSSAPKD